MAGGAWHIPGPTVGVVNGHTTYINLHFKGLLTGTSLEALMFNMLFFFTKHSNRAHSAPSAPAPSASARLAP